LTARALRLLLIALVLLVAGCSSALHWSPDYHAVRPGETLYSIAWHYDIDPRDLAAWNQLGDGSLIVPGQRLRLNESVAAVGRASADPGSGKQATQSGGSISKPPPPVQPVGSWQWPTTGSVVKAFGATPETESGIQVAGNRGQPVRAAAGGEVVYAGSGLVGYGQLVIIKHNPSYLSAYGHNESLQVKEGQRVESGQPIAQMGLGLSQRPLLHFEIRRNGQPVNPMKYLPRR